MTTSVQRRPAAVRSDSGRRPLLALVGLGIAATAGIGVYLFADLSGPVGGGLFTLRLASVGGLVVAGVAAALSTVVFHTVTRNHIITPSLMGFDAVYLLIATLAVFLLGADAFSDLGPITSYAINAAAMLVFCSVVFAPLFSGAPVPLDVVLLIAVVCGVVIRSVTALIKRLIDPAEFHILQDMHFASFTAVNPDLLTVVLIVSGTVTGLLFARRHVLDVMSLGQRQANALGVRHQREVLFFLALVAVLVAGSTALVGPIIFLGLIAAHLTYALCGTQRHVWTIPISAMVGIAAMVWAHYFVGRVFGAGAMTSVVIELVGGVLFIFLLLRKSPRK